MSIIWKHHNLETLVRFSVNLRVISTSCFCTNFLTIHFFFVIRDELSKMIVCYSLWAGAKVYMACRSLERAQQAADDIKNKTRVDDTQLIVMRLDLNSLKSVREFVSEFKTSKLSKTVFNSMKIRFIRDVNLKLYLHLHHGDWFIEF